jgi:NADH:ubiquinone oxidoreductase subunit H
MTRFNLDVFDTFFLIFSWYIKPLLVSQNFISTVQYSLTTTLIILLMLITNLTSNLLNPLIHILSTIKLTSYLSIFMGIKFIILIGLLVVVRGGIPRYRYDFLTKLGWIKTLSLVLIIFIINLLLSYL